MTRLADAVLPLGPHAHVRAVGAGLGGGVLERGVADTAVLAGRRPYEIPESRWLFGTVLGGRVVRSSSAAAPRPVRDDAV